MRFLWLSFLLWLYLLFFGMWRGERRGVVMMNGRRTLIVVYPDGLCRIFAP